MIWYICGIKIYSLCSLVPHTHTEIFGVDSVMNSFPDVIFTYKMMVSF